MKLNHRRGEFRSLLHQAVAAAAAPTTLALTFLVRNACGCESSILSFLLTGTAAVVNNLAVTVEKL